MTYQMDISKTSVQTMQSQGLSVKAGVEASYSGAFSVSASAHYGRDQKSSSAKALAKEDKTVKLYVFGGFPSESDPTSPTAFGEWAQSVPDAPMPVKYSLIPFYDLDIVDRTSYEIMFDHYGTYGYENKILELKNMQKDLDDGITRKSSDNLLRKCHTLISDTTYHAHMHHSRASEISSNCPY